MSKIRDVILVTIIIWLVFFLNYFLPVELNNWGILPRNLIGLRGVICSPFLHGNLMHITANTVPFLILGSMLYLFYPQRALLILVLSVLFSGLLVWIFARENSIHIGLSSVIYSLASFLIFAGIFSRKFGRIILAILIIIFYGGLIWGVLPTTPGVSWEGHLAGAFTGMYLAKIFYSKKKSKN